MNVKALKQILEPLPDQMPVVLTDERRYSRMAAGLHSAVQRRYLSQTAWRGLLVSRSDKPETCVVLVLCPGP